MDFHFNARIACEYGTDEAIIIECLYFWIKKNEANSKHFHDGNYWTYNSARAFAKLFPFWSNRQIERILKSLEKQNAVNTGNYNVQPYDRTKWYALSEDVKSLYADGENHLRKRVNENTQIGEPIPVTLPNKLTADILHQSKIDEPYIKDELHHSVSQPDVFPISAKVTKKKDDGYYDLKAIKDEYFDSELLPYIDYYLSVQASYHRADGRTLYIKRISKANLERLYGEIMEATTGIDMEDWEEAVQEHFDNLPKGNDGDILAFLEASRRYFG
jgi:hypothetical protein